jgi:leucyl/phenylalanyl-tRNA---protein transferase
MRMTDEITPDILLRAYAMGIFPMAQGRDDPEIHWVDPRRRGVLPIMGLHLSRSLRKRLLRTDYHVTANTAFGAVLDGCAARDETWINPAIHALYLALHRQGHAHSIEVWQDGTLAGGVYGVTLGAAFFGESMFSARRDSSKVALAWLVHRLRVGGFQLFDTQFITPHLATLGALEIPRAEYHRQLAAALDRPARFSPKDYWPSPSSVAGMSGYTQDSTQTS